MAWSTQVDVSERIATRRPSNYNQHLQHVNKYVSVHKHAVSDMSVAPCELLDLAASILQIQGSGCSGMQCFTVLIWLRVFVCVVPIWLQTSSEVDKITQRRRQTVTLQLTPIHSSFAPIHSNSINCHSKFTSAHSKFSQMSKPACPDECGSRSPYGLTSAGLKAAATFCYMQILSSTPSSLLDRTTRCAEFL